MFTIKIQDPEGGQTCIEVEQYWIEWDRSRCPDKPPLLRLMIPGPEPTSREQFAVGVSGAVMNVESSVGYVMNSRGATIDRFWFSGPPADYFV